MKKRKFRAFFFACAFLLFLLLMDYPYLSRLYNDIISGGVVASFTKSEEDADCGDRLALAVSYNRYLAGEGEFAPEILTYAGEAACTPEDPPYAGEEALAPEDPSHTGEEALAPEDPPYAGKESWIRAARVLCLKDPDLAGWIRIPSLDLILPLFIGTKDEVLAEGAGILEQHSLPVGGRSTHACISAHRGLPDRTLFTNLDMLHASDRIEVHTLGRSIFYEVTRSETVRPTNTQPLEIIAGKDLLTLITCTPYGINSHRLYVHAQRCEDSISADASSASLPGIMARLADPVFWKLWWWVPATVLLLSFLIVLVRKSLR